MMSRATEKAEFAKVFREIALFQDVPDAALRAIAKIGEGVYAYKGQTLIEEGEENGDLMILLEGRVGICLESINPSVEIAINKLNAGDVIGEMSLLEGGPRSATVVALERCRLVRFPTGKLNTLLEKHPDWALIFMRNLAKILCQRLRTMNRRILNLTRMRYF